MHNPLEEPVLLRGIAKENVVLSRKTRCRLTPDEPNKIWGTDASSTITGEGNATIFFVLDHFSADCLGIHAARWGTRFEALVPFRQAILTIFGNFKEGIAEGGRSSPLP